MVKNPPANAGDSRDGGLIPGLGRSLGRGIGNPLHYSCLENPMDRGAWQATVSGVVESDTTEATKQQYNTVNLKTAQVNFTGKRFCPKRRPPCLQMSITSPHDYLCFWPTCYKLEVPKSPFLGLQMLVVSPYCYLFLWPTSCKSEISTTPFSGLINLLEQFTKPRETFYLLDHQFIIKRYNQERPGRIDAQGKGQGKDTECPCPLCPHHCPSISTYSPTQKLSESLLLGFYEGFIIGLIDENHWPLMTELNLQLLVPTHLAGGGKWRVRVGPKVLIL